MMTTAIPSLVLEMSRENTARLKDAVDRELPKDPNPESAAEVAYLIFRNFEDIAWSWNRIHEELGAGMPGPRVRQALSLILRRFGEWLQLAGSFKMEAASIQSLSDIPDKLRKELVAAVAKIEAAAEKISAAREDAKGIEKMMDVPMPDLEPARLAEVEELYKQGRFVDFKEANARRKAGRQ
ncbi:MAG TPA: hypothetical protein VMF69_05825 [Gemmataceae bacterium]|nr:hypothetical protein [Gemmataceae bacterium]